MAHDDLVGKGVASGRLSATGFGSERPLCASAAALQQNSKRSKTELEACWDKNRRVEFAVISLDGRATQ